MCSPSPEISVKEGLFHEMFLENLLNMLKQAFGACFDPHMALF